MCYGLKQVLQSNKEGNKPEQYMGIIISPNNDMQNV